MSDPEGKTGFSGKHPGHNDVFTSSMRYNEVWMVYRDFDWLVTSLAEDMECFAGNKIETAVRA